MTGIWPKEVELLYLILVIFLAKNIRKLEGTFCGCTFSKGHKEVLGFKHLERRMIAILVVIKSASPDLYSKQNGF